MMAAHKYLRHFPATIIHRFRVLGIFQNRFIERIACRAARISKDTGHHTGNRIGNNHSAKLSSRKDIVSNGNQFICQVFFHAVVYPLIVSADQNQMVIVAVKLLGFILGKRDPGRRQENHPIPRPLLRKYRFTGFKKRPALHEHSRTAAIDGIIHLMMPAVGKLPRIRHRHLYEPRVQSAFNHALSEECFYKLGK